MAKPSQRQLDRMLAAHRAGRFDEAVAAAREFTRRWPEVPNGWLVLATGLHAGGRPAEAEPAYRRLLALRPDQVDARYNHGLVLAALGRFDAAAGEFRRVVEAAPRRAEAHNNLGNALVELGRPEEAVAAYRRAAELSPGRSDPARNLGNALKSLGRLEEAEAAYRQALECDPDNPAIHRQLFSLRPVAPDDPCLAQLEALASRPDLSRAARAEAGYALGKACADMGRDPAEVFERYAAAARLVRADLDYDVSRDERLLASVAEVFDDDWLAARAGAGVASELPVFVVGMPRSGTTLVERMLAAHPCVFCAGESYALRRVVADLGAGRGRPFPAWARNLEGDDIAGAARAYLDRLAAAAGPAERITDKMPGNFMLLGLIAAMFPEARVIHVRRDPLDTCWSLFSHRFERGQHYSYDLAELGRYYRAHARLMAHWRAVLPGDMMLEIDYEALVRAPAEGLAAMLEHCGLAWDAAGLEPGGTGGAVRTASAAQVRRPIHTDAIGQGARMRAHLGPLLEALGPLA